MKEHKAKLNPLRVTSTDRFSLYVVTAIQMLIAFFSLSVTSMANDLFAPYSPRPLLLEEMLMSSKYVVVADVMNVINVTGCSRVSHIADCNEVQKVRLAIRLKEILGASPDNMAAASKLALGDVIEIDATLLQGKGIDISESSIDILPHADKVLTKSDVAESLVGEEYIFGIRNLVGNEAAGRAAVWLLARKSWAKSKFEQWGWHTDFKHPITH